MGGERMRRMHQRAEAFGRRSENDDVRMIRPFMGQDHVDAIVQQIRQHRARGPDRDREADAGMLALKGGNRTRHHVDGGGFSGAHADMPAHQALQFPDLVAEPMEVAERSPHMRGEGLAGRGQADAALQPVEQAGAEFLFQVEDAAIEGR